MAGEQTYLLVEFFNPGWSHSSLLDLHVTKTTLYNIRCVEIPVGQCQLAMANWSDAALNITFEVLKRKSLPSENCTSFSSRLLARTSTCK